jgi:hypothetical protein
MEDRLSFGTGSMPQTYDFSFYQAHMGRGQTQLVLVLKVPISQISKY